MSDACATASAAFADATRASSCCVSSSASTWPALTVALKSTSTRSMIPDTSLPTSTWLIGCSVPVAVTVTSKGP